MVSKSSKTKTRSDDVGSVDQSPKSNLTRSEEDSGLGNERQFEELSQKIENKLVRWMNNAIRASEFNILKALGSLLENPQQNQRLNNTFVDVEEGAENLIQCSSSRLGANQENINPSLSVELDADTYEEERASSSRCEDSSLDDELIRIEDLLSVANIIGRQYPKDFLSEKLLECKIDDFTLDFPMLLKKLEEMSRDFDPCAHIMLQKAFKVIDKEKKGYVTVEEVKVKVREIMPSVPSAEFDSLFEGAEKHGKIDIGEFLDLIDDI